MLLSGETILASRIDTPSLFSKKTCIEKLSFGAGTLGGQFCDQGRTVSVALGPSLGHRPCRWLRFPAPQIHRGASLRSVGKDRCVEFQNREPNSVLSRNPESSPP